MRHSHKLVLVMAMAATVASLSAAADDDKNTRTPEPSAHPIPENCSRAISREVVDIVIAEFLPVAKKYGISMASCCVLNPENDMYRWEQDVRGQSGTRHKCLACQKTFKSEHYLNLHMARFHSDKVNKSGVCFADYCAEVSCTQQQWLQYYDNPPVMAKLKEQCTNVVKSCFPTSNKTLDCEIDGSCPKFRHHNDKEEDGIGLDSEYAAQTRELAYRRAQAEVINSYCERHPYEIWTARKLYAIVSWWTKLVLIIVLSIIAFVGLIYLLVRFVTDEDLPGDRDFYERVETRKVPPNNAPVRRRAFKKED